MLAPDFSLSPFLVIWEMTRACDLACIHCRASAIPTRNPGELSTEEAFELLRQVRSFAWGPGEPVPAPGSGGNGSLPCPLVVLTGGDPLRREDIYQIIEHGTELGIRMTVTPSGTWRVTPGVIRKLKSCGLQRLAISLDASTAQRHDEFRKVSGSFDWSLEILRSAREIGVETQVNTTMTRHNLHDFAAMARLVEDVGAALWSVFFLVSTGRGQRDDELTAGEYEQLFEQMDAVQQAGKFDLKSTAAPHYRRYLLQHGRGRARGASLPPTAAARSIGRSFRAVNDADGFLFVSHTGDICPSGFLPVAASNIRHRSLVTTYRESPLFVNLRDRDLLHGKCGVCEFRHVCGGSRARAYSRSGDVHESDPCCAYVPAPYRRLVELGAAKPVETYFAGW